MKRLQHDDCGFATTLNAIGGKWKTQILWEIAAAPRRFGELKRLLPGVSEKMLAQQLREMGSMTFNYPQFVCRLSDLHAVLEFDSMS